MAESWHLLKKIMDLPVFTTSSENYGFSQKNTSTAETKAQQGTKIHCVDAYPK